MWPPIVEELKSENPKFRQQAAWVCGTATQNNPKAQAAVSFHGNWKLDLEPNGDTLQMLRPDPVMTHYKGKKFHGVLF